MFPFLKYNIYINISIDDVFVACTTIHDIPSEDLQEIGLELGLESQNTSSRRPHLKKHAQSPVDCETPNTPLATAGLVSIDIKKTVNVRDSGFIDDEELQSSKENELPTYRLQHNGKQNETISVDTTASNDLLTRKLRSKTKIYINF